MTDPSSADLERTPAKPDNPLRNGDFTIVGQRHLLATTKDVQHLPVPLQSWKNIRKKTESIGGESWILPGIATTLFGGVLAAALSLFTSPAGVSNRDTWWFLGVCVLGTLGFATAALVQRSQNRATAEEVIAVMDDVEALINMPS